MGRWARRIGIFAVAVAALYLVGGSVAGALMANWLLTPGNVDWSGAKKPAPADPMEIGYRGDPLQALQLPFENVTYESELGPSEAWFVPADPASPVWAVYVHGIGGIRENGYRQLSILNEAAIPTLLITYRNDAGGVSPASSPPFFSLGMTEWTDLEAAIGWMLEQGAERIVLVAESMGGAIAGQYLIRSETAEVVTALALDAPALDVPAIFTGYGSAMNLPLPNVIGGGALWLLSTVGPVKLNEATSLDQVASFPGPVFLAHGTNDKLVPFAISERLLALRSGPTTFVKSAGEHLMSYKEDPARYRAEMLGFLEAVKASANDETDQ